MKNLKFINKIAITLITMLLVFCGCSQKLDNPKYKIGDIVYLKPDSTKVIIISDDVIGGEYEIAYDVNDLFRNYCDEEDIYGAESNQSYCDF